MSSDREERDDDGWVEGVSDQKGINSIPLVRLINCHTNNNIETRIYATERTCNIKQYCNYYFV